MGLHKRQVAQQRYTNTDELKQVVTDFFKEVTPQMLRRMSDRTWHRINICYDNDKAQTESIDRSKITILNWVTRPKTK